MTGLVIVEIFCAERADRNQAVGAGIAELDEQSGTGDAGNPALKGGANPVGEEMRDQPVGGFTLGFHRAPFGNGDLRRDFA